MPSLQDICDISWEDSKFGLTQQLTPLVVDAGCGPGPLLGYQPEHHQHVVSSCSLSVWTILGFLTAWWPGSRGDRPQRTRWKGKCFHDLALEVEKRPLRLLCWLRQLPKPTKSQREGPTGWTTPWEECQGHITRRACVMGGTGVIIWRKICYSKGGGGSDSVLSVTNCEGSECDRQ